MKLISQFRNRYNKITYKTYQTENGIKILHLDNPATTNFDFAIVHNAGAAYEDQEQVPRGTAHFLEHMLLNPNETFQSKDDINKFEQGSIKRPAIYINAFTNKKYITFTGNGNEKGKMRILNRLESIYQFPKQKFAEQLEKERGIILAEKSRKLKKENDNYLASLDFLFQDIQKEFAGDVLGEPEEIKSITIDNLESFFLNRIAGGDTVMAIQSNGELNGTISRKLEHISKKISKKISKNNSKTFRKVTLENTFRVGSFSEERLNGVNVSFIYFEKDRKNIDYKEHDLRFIYAKLLEWLAFEILREKKSLIYGFSPFRTSSTSFDYNMYGYRFTTEKEKVEETIREYYEILHNTSFEFLKEEKGREWFGDVISTYIFPKTIVYDDTLAESISPRLFKNQEIFNYNMAVKEAKKITISDLEQYIEKQLRIPSNIWIESDMSKEKMLDIIKSSPFDKEFNKKKR